MLLVVDLPPFKNKPAPKNKTIPKINLISSKCSEIQFSATTPITKKLKFYKLFY